VFRLSWSEIRIRRGGIRGASQSHPLPESLAQSLAFDLSALILKPGPVLQDPRPVLSHQTLATLSDEARYIVSPSPPWWLANDDPTEPSFDWVREESCPQMVLSRGNR